MHSKFFPLTFASPEQSEEHFFIELDQHPSYHNIIYQQNKMEINTILC